MDNGLALYARRSSDSDDRQVLSPDSQLEELRRFAAERGLVISEEFTESASAREPGRPVFNALMKRLRTGKVKSILAWRVDRLARSMVHHLRAIRGALGADHHTRGLLHQYRNAKFLR